MQHSYLRDVLINGAKPFLYRSGVRSLLNIADSYTHCLCFRPPLPSVGFRYAHYGLMEEPRCIHQYPSSYLSSHTSHAIGEKKINQEGVMVQDKENNKAVRGMGHQMMGREMMEVTNRNMPYKKETFELPNLSLKKDTHKEKENSSKKVLMHDKDEENAEQVLRLLGQAAISTRSREDLERSIKRPAKTNIQSEELSENRMDRAILENEVNQERVIVQRKGKDGIVGRLKQTNPLDEAHVSSEKPIKDRERGTRDSLELTKESSDQTMGREMMKVTNRNIPHKKETFELPHLSLKKETHREKVVVQGKGKDGAVRRLMHTKPAAEPQEISEQVIKDLEWNNIDIPAFTKASFDQRKGREMMEVTNRNMPLSNERFKLPHLSLKTAMNRETEINCEKKMNKNKALRQDGEEKDFDRILRQLRQAGISGKPREELERSIKNLEETTIWSEELSENSMDRVISEKEVNRDRLMVQRPYSIIGKEGVTFASPSISEAHNPVEMDFVYRSNQHRSDRIEQLRFMVHEYASKLSSKQAKSDEETKEHQTQELTPVPTQQVIMVKGPSDRLKTPYAFWERMYLGHSHINILR
ncbi:MAG: hypothetical protein ACMUJM_18675 [bacterium]